MTEIASDITLSAPAVARPPRAIRSAATNGLRRWLGEPFLHFLVLGGALFLVSHYLDQRGRFTRIVITPDTVASIAESYRLQYGRLPTSPQLQSLTDGYIRDQIYYHEALKLGLDQNDEIVRRRLVQKYEFLQQDLAIDSEPTDVQLQAYLQKHADRYRTPDTVAFAQVFFSVDRRGETAAHEAARLAAQELNLAGVTRAPEAGDPFPGPQDFPALSHDEAGRVFGESAALTEGLFHLPVGRWSQPLRSAYGWHIIHVDSFSPSRPADFQTVKEQVRRDFIDEARTARNEANFASLRKSFEVVRE